MKHLLEKSKTEFAKLLVERMVSSLACVVHVILAADVSGKDEQRRLQQRKGVSLVQVISLVRR